MARYDAGRKEIIYHSRLFPGSQNLSHHYHADLPLETCPTTSPHLSTVAVERCGDVVGHLSKGRSA